MDPVVSERSISGFGPCRGAARGDGAGRLRRRGQLARDVHGARPAWTSGACIRLRCLIAVLRSRRPGQVETALTQLLPHLFGLSSSSSIPRKVLGLRGARHCDYHRWRRISPALQPARTTPCRATSDLPTCCDVARRGARLLMPRGRRRAAPPGGAGERGRTQHPPRAPDRGAAPGAQVPHGGSPANSPMEDTRGRCIYQPLCLF
jgi:hypothetical protein